MSAILSSDDLNDFISPGVACIKPVETLKPTSTPENLYEVTTEDKLQAENAPPAQISLTDCLACSGCVTSAEAVLVSLQSHTEVLNTLDSHPSLDVQTLLSSPHNVGDNADESEGKLFVASVSPQVRASLAASYGISERKASYLIEQLLAGAHGLRTGGKHGSAFSYIVDTNQLREACLVLTADETIPSATSSETRPSNPILSSACPGWICYAEKTHPHVLPHLSRLKSPQALTGTFLKSVLSKKLSIPPSKIWHLAIMPCFDKKLEASRSELTNEWWQSLPSFTDTTTTPTSSNLPVRDVDCVITARELLTLAFDRSISLPSLPLQPLPSALRPRFPDPNLHNFLFPPSPVPSPPNPHSKRKQQCSEAGPSGGYLHHVLLSHQRLYPGSTITATRGRNADVIEYALTSPTSPSQPILKCARYYGFRNIQNLVRKLKPPRTSRLPGAMAATKRNPVGTSSHGQGGFSEYAYVEVMACPGGCTNGGGQLKMEDANGAGNQGLSQNGNGNGGQTAGLQAQREWLRRVDEAYYSAESGSDSASASESDSDDASSNSALNDGEDVSMPDAPVFHALPDSANDQNDHDHDHDQVNNISPSHIHAILSHWAAVTDVPLQKLAYTEFRTVESDVGKPKKKSDTERVAALAGLGGGGW